MGKVNPKSQNSFVNALRACLDLPPLPGTTPYARGEGRKYLEWGSRHLGDGNSQASRHIEGR